jgi:hypothetical protein
LSVAIETGKDQRWLASSCRKGSFKKIMVPEGDTWRLPENVTGGEIGDGDHG